VTPEPRRCHACGAKVRDSRVKCTRCGAPLEHMAPVPAPRGLPAWAPTAAVVAFAAAGALVWALAAGGPRGAEAVDVAPATEETSRPAPTAVASGNAPDGAPAAAIDAANAGAAAFRSGRFADAVTLYEQAVAASPDHPEWLNNLGQALARAGREHEAIPLLERAVAASPDTWSYRFNLAHARGRAGDWAGAVAAYEEADRLFPDDHATLYNLGLAMQRAGRDADALGPLERAVALDPSDPGFVLALAQSYVRAARPEEAARAFEKYLELAPAGADAAAAREALSLLRGGPPQPPAAGPAGAPTPAQGPA
jgi:tetratricopeptide (TPR) repeat protein